MLAQKVLPGEIEALPREPTKNRFIKKYTETVFGHSQISQFLDSHELSVRGGAAIYNGGRGVGAGGGDGGRGGGREGGRVGVVLCNGGGAGIFVASDSEDGSGGD